VTSGIRASSVHKRKACGEVAHCACGNCVKAHCCLKTMAKSTNPSRSASSETQTRGESIAERVSERGRSRSRGPSQSQVPQATGVVEPNVALGGGEPLDKATAQALLQVIDLEEKVDKVEDRVSDVEDDLKTFGKTVEELGKTMTEGNESLTGRINSLVADKNSLRAYLTEALNRLTAAENELGLLKTTVLGRLYISVAQNKLEAPHPSPSHIKAQGMPERLMRWGCEQFFEGQNIEDDLLKIKQATYWLQDGAASWWRRLKMDADEGIADPIVDWGEFKRELKKQFYPKTAYFEAKMRFVSTKHTGTIKEYIKLDNLAHVDDVTEKEKVFYFIRGLKDWARNEMWNRGGDDIPDLRTDIQYAEALYDYKERNRSI